MQLTKNVHVNTGLRGANSGYVITEDGIVMIESPFRPTDAIKWHDEIKSKGKVKYLINTEPHDDHISGDFLFDAPVIAQEKTRDAILVMDVKKVLDILAHIDPESGDLVKGFKLPVPAITFSDRLNLYVGRHNFNLIHLPGHTSGETAVYIPEERIVFSGDNVTYQMQGFMHHADPIAWLESLKRIGELDVDYIVPGHGGVCDKSYLSEQAAFVEGSIITIKEALKSGWTKEEAISRIKRFPSPYSFDVGTDDIVPIFMRMAISRMYDIFSK